MADQTIALGALLWWYPETASTADISTKPGTYTLTLGALDDAQQLMLRNNVTYEDVFTPQPALGERVDRPPLNQAQSLTLPIAQMNRRTWEVVLAATISADSGDQNFVPGETPFHRGWLKIDAYDKRTKAAKLLFERFGQLEIGDIPLTGKVVRPVLQFEAFFSTAQAGTVKSL